MVEAAAVADAEEVACADAELEEQADAELEEPVPVDAKQDARRRGVARERYLRLGRQQVAEQSALLQVMLHRMGVEGAQLLVEGEERSFLLRCNAMHVFDVF